MFTASRRWMTAFALAQFVLALALPSGRSASAAPDETKPPGEDVTAKLAAVESEIALLRQADPAESPTAARYADELERQLRRLRADWETGDGNAKDAPGGADAAAPELYVVGFYEGSMPNGPKKFGTAVVDLQVTDRPVVLALCAYEPIRWELRVAPGVRLQRVIVGGYKEQIVEPAPPAGVQVETHVAQARDQNYFFTYPKAEDSGEAPAAEKLRALTGLPIATLQGAYRYPGQPVVVGPRDTEWRRQRVMSRLEPLWREATAPRRAELRVTVAGNRFTAIRWLGGFPPQVELVDFTPAGYIEGTSRPLPRNINRVTVDPRGPTWYAVADRGSAARLDVQAGQATPIEIKEDIPEFSWPCGAAYDTKRNRLIVATMGGTGYLYACDTITDTWSLLCDLKNLDFQALAYSEAEDCLYALKMNRSGRAGLVVCQLQPDGTPVREINVKADVPIEPGEGILVPTQLVVLGKQLVLLVPPPRRELMARRMRGPPDPRRAAAAPEPPPPLMKCLVVDPATGEVTHSGELPPLPAAAVAPAAMEGRKLQELWNAVRQAGPQEAQKSVEAIAPGGDGTVAVIRAALPPAPAAPDEAAVRTAIGRLEGDDWKQREEAAAELTAAGGAIEPALRAAMAATKSQEARQRLDAVLKQLQTLREETRPEAVDAALGDSAVRTRLRAIRALERIGTPAAVRLLREIAGGPPGSLEVVHARRALGKM